MSDISVQPRTSAVPKPADQPGQYPSPATPFTRPTDQLAAALRPAENTGGASGAKRKIQARRTARA